MTWLKLVYPSTSVTSLMCFFSNIFGGNLQKVDVKFLMVVQLKESDCILEHFLLELLSTNGRVLIVVTIDF